MTAPGRYCAPLRCYCGDPACPAYGTYRGLLAQVWRDRDKTASTVVDGPLGEGER